MHCPHCHAPMTPYHKDGVMIDVCVSCKGIWLDRGELERIIANSTSYQSYDQHNNYSHNQYPPQHQNYYKHKHQNPYMKIFKDLFD